MVSILTAMIHVTCLTVTNQPTLSECSRIANLIFVVGHISAKIPDPIRTLKSNAAEGP